MAARVIPVPVLPNVRQELEQNLGTVPHWFEHFPQDFQESFWSLWKNTYLTETTIPNKYKELIGLGVSAATRCRYCTLFHTEAAKLHGATPEEVHEASSLAGVTMAFSTFLNSEQIDFERFRKETEQIVAYVRKQMTQQGKAAPARTS